MRKIRKLLAVMLVFILCLSLFTVFARADGGNSKPAGKEYSEEEITSEEESEEVESEDKKISEEEQSDEEQSDEELSEESSEEKITQ